MQQSKVPHDSMMQRDKVSMRTCNPADFLHKKMSSCILLNPNVLMNSGKRLSEALR